MAVWVVHLSLLRGKELREPLVHGLRDEGDEGAHQMDRCHCGEGSDGCTGKNTKTQDFKLLLIWLLKKGWTSASLDNIPDTGHVLPQPGKSPMGFEFSSPRQF